MITLNESAALPRRALHAAALALLLVSTGGRWTPAAAGNLCIAMSGSGGQVAGVQLDLKWDGSCMSADQGSGTGARCSAEPSTGKDIRTVVSAGPTLRAIFFSMADTNPIPDGNLFCCNFSRATSAKSACCSLTMGNVRGSDSAGKAIPASDFTLLATMDGQPCAASDSGGSQPPPARAPLPRQPGGVAPPAVSIPGGAPPAPAQQAPAGPGGRLQAPAPRAPLEQPQPAPEEAVPGEAPAQPTEAPTRPLTITTPARTPAVGTPTVKARATAGQGTPTAAAKKPAGLVRTPAVTPATPAATPKAEPKKATGY